MPESETVLVLVVAFALALLAVAAAKLFDERVHHAVAFPAIWSVLLVLSVVALPFGFFGIEVGALPLFLLGAVLFVAGAGLGERLASGRGVSGISPIDTLHYPKIAAAAFAMNIVLVPLWWGEVVAITGADDLLAIGFRMRWMTTMGVDQHGFVVGNWLVLGLILTLILSLGAFRSLIPGWVVLVVCAPWVVANLLSNGRAGLVQTLVALMYLRLTEHKPIDGRTLLAVVAVFAAVFGGGVMLVEKSGATPDSSFVEALIATANNLLEYVAQGPILFSRWQAGLTDVVPSWDSLVFFCSLVQSTGLCTIAEVHQEFAVYGDAKQHIGNVYTMYFAMLPKYGWGGVVLFTSVFGVWAAFHHRRHRQRAHLFHSLFAAQLFAAALLSGFGDLFGSSLNYLIKTTIVCALLQTVLALRPARSPSGALRAR